MSNLTVINHNGINTTDSREVAEMIGKDHAHLMRDIQGYIKVLDPNPNLDSANFFILSNYKDANNQERPCYLLTKQGCEMLANKMTGQKGILFTAEYVQTFNKMETQIKQLSPMDQLKLQYQVLEQHEEKLSSFDNRLAKVENNTTIDYSQQEELRDLGNKKVVAILGGSDAPAYKELNKKVFSSFWRDYKRKLNVNSYKNTLVKDFEIGKRVIIEWQPSKEIAFMIKGCNAQIRM